MTDADRPLTPAAIRFWGLACIAVGAAVMLLATGVVAPRGADAPPWIIAIAGGTFIVAGVALVLRSFLNGDMREGEMPPTRPLGWRALYVLIGLAMVAMLAAIGTWVAFGPGERSFSMSVPLFGSGPGNPWIGRVAFGVGAILTWLFFAIAAVTFWRKLLRRDPQS